MEWLNEPAEWAVSEGVISLVTDPKTDFWQRTHYGFRRDDGHVYGRKVEGDFSVEVTFSAEYETLYDQAGLMIRLDAENWIKAGIEFTDGKHHLSVVATRGFSDWSVLPLEGDPGPVRLRMSRYGEAVKVECSVGGAAFAMLRLAYLAPSTRAFAGAMACSPERGGLRVRFWGLGFGEAERGLH